MVKLGMCICEIPVRKGLKKAYKQMVALMVTRKPKCAIWLFCCPGCFLVYVYTPLSEFQVVQVAIQLHFFFLSSF